MGPQHLYWISKLPMCYGVQTVITITALKFGNSTKFHDMATKIVCDTLHSFN